jgi:hypothetical protein
MRGKIKSGKKKNERKLQIGEMLDGNYSQGF